MVDADMVTPGTATLVSAARRVVRSGLRLRGSPEYPPRIMSRTSAGCVEGPLISDRTVAAAASSAAELGRGRPRRRTFRSRLWQGRCRREPTTRRPAHAPRVSRPAGQGGCGTWRPPRRRDGFGGFRVGPTARRRGATWEPWTAHGRVRRISDRTLSHLPQPTRLYAR